MKGAARNRARPASILAQNLVIEGSVQSDSEVRARIAGGITAKQVRLHSTASVEGDITAEQLAIEPGASSEGRSIKLQRPKAEVALPPAPVPVPTATPSAQDLTPPG